MIHIKEETVLKLSKSQLQSVINDHVLKDNGLPELFSMLVNGLMFSERQAFLSDDDSKGNKGNGYRKATR